MDALLILPFSQMSSEDIERRKRLESAVEDDDWSSVIDGQTKLTEEAKTEAEAPTATIIRFVPVIFTGSGICVLKL